MQGYFWTNTIWYLLLLACTIAMLAVAFARADNRRFVVAFFLAVLGLFYMFEYVLVALLDAYHYHPMVVPADDFQDSVFGNMFSQPSIAAACMLVIVLRLRVVWYFVIAALYYAIELLFVWLGIYELHWYQSYYTPVILVPLIWAVRRWHNRVVVSGGRAGETALVFLGTFAASANTVYLMLKLTGIHLFTGGFYLDPSRDHTTTLVLYGFFFLGAAISIQRLRLGWQWKALLLASLYLVQYAAFEAGLMEFRDGWFVWATLLEIAAITFWAWLLDRLVHMRRPSADGLPKTSGP